MGFIQKVLLIEKRKEDKLKALKIDYIHVNVVNLISNTNICELMWKESTIVTKRIELYLFIHNVVDLEIGNQIQIMKFPLKSRMQIISRKY